jgi:acetolactate synthase-1/2/3 large subunit
MVGKERVMMTAARLDGGQAAIRALEAHGVEVVFGIPGVHTLRLYDALYGSRIRHILSRHEQGAGFMADGYARATGRPGVCIIITGPGLTNVATAIGEAYADSQPVLVISSNVQRADAGQMRGNLHDLTDQQALMGTITKWHTSVGDSRQIGPAIARAFQQMQTHRPRPTHVEIPIDVLDEVCEHPPVPVQEGVAPGGDPAAVDRAAALLRGAQRVVILAGGGAVASRGAAPLLARLAERIGAPVLTTVMGKGAIPEDHAYAVGAFYWSWARDSAASRLLTESDAILIVGSKVGHMTSGGGRMPLPAQRVQIDLDPAELGRNYPISVGIAGDAAAVLGQLLDVLGEWSPAAPWSPDDVANVREAMSQPASPAEAGHLAYLRAVRAALPRDAIVAADMTMMGYLANRHLPIYEPRTYLFPRGFGTLGYAPPAAYGAKVGQPERAVVAIVGDGGFQFTMQELGAAVQHRLGVPILIFNDSTFTAVKRAMDRQYGGRTLAVDLVNPDYVRLADAYGISGERASSPAALGEAIGRALDRDVPTLIDIPISPDW